MYKISRILLLGLIMLIYLPSQAQNIKSISTNFGYTDDGLATLVNFSLIDSRSQSYFYEAGIYSGYLKENKSDYNVKVNLHSLNLGYFKKIDLLSTISGIIETYVGLGGVLGIENINNGNKSLLDGALIKSKDGFIYGGFGALETEIYLSDKFYLLSRYTYFHHANSEVGKSKFIASVGLKYLIF